MSYMQLLISGVDSLFDISFWKGNRKLEAKNEKLRTNKYENCISKLPYSAEAHNFPDILYLFNGN